MLGADSVYYINDASFETPTWTPVDLVNDMALNATWNEAQANARVSQVDSVEPSSLALEATGNIRVNPDDDAYQALRTAFITRAPIDVLVLNASKEHEGADGFRFTGKVLTWSEDQAFGNVIYKQFNVKPCISENVPQAAQVVSGSLVFSDIGAPEGS
jgi:hypothetical protein